MFSDPQSVTVNAVAKSMPRVNTASVGNKTTTDYLSADGLYSLTISQQRNADGRVRTLVKFQQKAVVTNPLDSTNDYDVESWQIVMDRPSFGFTAQQCDYNWAGIKAWLDTTAVTKLFGGET
jgi:hypothetical protein